MSRRIERQVAVEACYAADIRGCLPTELKDTGERAGEYTATLLKGVSSRMTELDALLASAMDGRWTIDRLNSVDRAILRVGTWELITEQAAVGILINEAIELARGFNGSDSARFVNGVLDRVARQVAGGGGGGGGGGSEAGGGAGGAGVSGAADSSDEGDASAGREPDVSTEESSSEIGFDSEE